MPSEADILKWEPKQIQEIRCMPACAWFNKPGKSKKIIEASLWPRNTVSSKEASKTAKTLTHMTRFVNRILETQFQLSLFTTTPLNG